MIFIVLLFFLFVHICSLFFCFLLHTFGLFCFIYFDESVSENCIHLKKVILNEGLKVIGNMAFKNTAVTEIVIPDSVTDIGTDAFAICSKLTSISVKKGSKAEAALRGDKRLVLRP